MSWISFRMKIQSIGSSSFYGRSIRRIEGASVTTMIGSPLFISTDHLLSRAFLKTHPLNSGKQVIENSDRFLYTCCDFCKRCSDNPNSSGKKISRCTDSRSAEF